MTQPRQIFPKTCYFLTRRCTQRQFLLTPDKLTNAIFAYCIAVAADECNIKLVAWTVMSNHYHAVVYDEEGRVPEFIQMLHLMVAKAINRRYGRKENVWSSDQASVVRLVHASDVFDKVVYTLANPVAANLVRHATDWRGSSSLRLFGKAPITVHRPPNAFSFISALRESAPLGTTHPPTVNEDPDEWRQRVLAELAKREDAKEAERQRTRTTTTPIKTLCTDKPDTVPEEKHTIHPHIACKWGLKKELEELDDFYMAHEAARKQFIRGEFDALFPFGTYRIRHWGATVAKTREMRFA